MSKYGQRGLDIVHGFDQGSISSCHSLCLTLPCGRLSHRELAERHEALQSERKSIFMVYSRDIKRPLS